MARVTSEPRPGSIVQCVHWFTGVVHSIVHSPQSNCLPSSLLVPSFVSAHGRSTATLQSTHSLFNILSLPSRSTSLHTLLHNHLLNLIFPTRSTLGTRCWPHPQPHNVRPPVPPQRSLGRFVLPIRSRKQQSAQTACSLGLVSLEFKTHFLSNLRNLRRTVPPLRRPDGQRTSREWK